MQRISIARSLRLALTGLTVVLAALAAVGVAGLYQARQRYDDTLTRSSQLSSAAAQLATAAVVRQEVRRDVRGPSAPAAVRRAQAAHRLAAARALSLAGTDAVSLRLVRHEVSQRSARGAVTAAGAVERRQAIRQRQARGHTRSDSRKAVVATIGAALLALVAVLALVTLLIRSLRRPLDELVQATQSLARGDLSRRVAPSGPRELRDLGWAFNEMGAELLGATARLEQERTRLASTIASLGDGVLVTEPGSSIVDTVNPRATELVPEIPPGVAADSPDSPLPPSAEAQSNEVTIEHRGRTLSVSSSRLNHGDNGVDRAEAATVWTVRDVSERARLERAKSEFVATASHELRSPLTSIKGFVELLATSPGAMSARQREFVDIILRSTDRLAELVNDLLDVARIEAGHVEIHRRAVDVGQAVREVAELIGPRVEAKHQALRCQIAPALPLALAEPTRLRQIVANLVTNAHLYTPDGGRIEISASGDGPWVRITVSDSGIGMSAEELEHVFERFYRGADGRSSPGTGLGLSIVKSLVDLHEGRVEVDSRPDQGTTFTVLIPSASGALDLAPSLEALRGRRILVVDDEPEIAQLIADQLAPFEVSCTIAPGGERALEHLREGRFDAVTLDIRMPGMSGLDVVRRIREDPATRETPVVFVSVFSDHQDLAREWVVSKPIDAEELREVLGAAVSSGRSRVLVVARDEVREDLVRSLEEQRIEYQWETSGAAAARVCGERHFEVALVDVGLRNPQAVLQALNLRGRRLRRAVILFSDGVTPAPPGIERLGLEVVPIAQAGQALVDALHDEPRPEPGATGAR